MIIIIIINFRHFYWASVASWFFRPDAAHPPFPPGGPLAGNLPNIRGGSSPRPSVTRSGSEHGRHFSMAPTICTVS
ncbi:hypothetical protein Phum_PHUM243570 [Pediculus humanus corporis]|uniref:Uncharacterized protein n=1 Tax=Pediculus humanus subsp. corporis TaxID=121224 RepID=E0VJD6_PEDHC|nr:uncharacterized protein Phum_PHUM243570 [Pediculus humanus corporis]EEB13492.1 hypothetical protein Phum_PHUM243570 [Pediculus humanus corporis]